MKTSKRSTTFTTALAIILILGGCVIIPYALAGGQFSSKAGTPPSPSVLSREVAQYSTRTETTSQNRTQTTFRAWCDIDYKDGGHASRYLGSYTIYGTLGPQYGFNVSNCDNTTVR